MCVVQTIDKKKVAQISQHSFDGEQFFEDIFWGPFLPGIFSPGIFFPGDHFPKPIFLVTFFPRTTVI